MCQNHQTKFAGKLFADLRAGADKPEHPPWHPLAGKRKSKKKSKKKRAKAKKDVEVTYIPKRGSAKKRAQAAHARKRRHKVGDMVLIHTWIGGVSETGPCDDCSEMDGQSIEDGEEFDIDTLDGTGVPPVHPNCTCQVESTWVEHGGDEQ